MVAADLLTHTRGMRTVVAEATVAATVAAVAHTVARRSFLATESGQSQPSRSSLPNKWHRWAFATAEKCCTDRGFGSLNRSESEQKYNT